MVDEMHLQEVINFFQRSQQIHSTSDNDKSLRDLTILSQYPDYVNCLLTTVTYPPYQIQSFIFLRQYITQTHNVTQPITTTALKFSLNPNLSHSTSLYLLSECYKLGSVSIKDFIIRTIFNTLTTSPTSHVITAALYIVDEDAPAPEGRCGVFLAPIISAVQYGDVGAQRAGLQYLYTAASKFPDLLSDCGPALIEILFNLRESPDSSIRTSFGLLCASFLTTDPDLLTPYATSLVTAGQNLSNDLVDEVACVGFSLIVATVHAFKIALFPSLHSILTQIVRRVDNIVGDRDVVPLIGEDALLRQLTTTLDELVTEYHDAVIEDVVILVQSAKWASALFIISTIVKGLEHQEKFFEIFGWVVKNIFEEFRKGIVRTVALWTIEEMYPFLNSILQVNDYEELLNTVLRAPIQVHSLLLLETFIDDQNNIATQNHINEILSWTLHAIEKTNESEVIVLLVETLTAISDRSPALFEQNLNLFQIFSRVIISKLYPDLGITERLIQNFSYVIPKFGNLAIAGCETQLASISLKLMQSEDYLDQVASLQLLNSLIETTGTPTQLIYSVSNITNVILNGMKSPQENVSDQSFVLLGDVLMETPTVFGDSTQLVVVELLNGIKKGDPTVRLWAAGIMLKVWKNELIGYLSNFTDAFVGLLQLSVSTTSPTSVFFKRNLCVCFGRVALCNVELVAPHLSSICESLIDTILELDDDEARIATLQGLGHVICRFPLNCKSGLMSVVKVFYKERQLTPQLVQFCNIVLESLRNTFTGEPYQLLWQNIV